MVVIRGTCNLAAWHEASNIEHLKTNQYTVNVLFTLNAYTMYLACHCTIFYFNLILLHFASNDYQQECVLVVE